VRNLWILSSRCSFAMCEGWMSDPMLARVLPRSLIEWYGSGAGQWFHDALAADIGKSEPRATRPDLSVPIGRAAAMSAFR
jgi:hypothetical protein